MRKIFIILITGVGIISAIALYFIVDNFNINTMDTTERMTFFLQVLAGFVTACISIWGLSIAHRKNKHWEIEQCNDLWEEFQTLNNKRSKFIDDFIASEKIVTEKDKKMDEKLTDNIFNVFEHISLLEKKSYIDSDILYDMFYNSLFGSLASGTYDDYLKKLHQENSHVYYHTRTLYIKWKDRYEDDIKNKDLTDSWTEMWELINEAREK